MYFRKIVLTNIFSYYQENCFSFKSPEKGRNVVIIEGRNGQGKTSFLNAISLLFLGEHNETLRRKVQRSRTPKIKEYVLGDDRDWWGIFNRKARQDNEKTCSVLAILNTELGNIEIKRYWQLDQLEKNYVSELEYKSELEGTKTGKDAEESLANLLPWDLLPFFFFDGEDIQTLAEANTLEKVKRVEKLLNITAINRIIEQNKKCKRAWQSKTDDLNLQNNIRTQELEIELHNASISSIDKQYQSLQLELESVDSEIQRIQDSIDYYTGQSGKTDKAKLNEQLKQKKDLLESEYAHLSNFLESDFYLRINPILIDEALPCAESYLNMDNAMVDAAKEEIRNALRFAPYSTPELSKQQIEFYINKISRRLDNLKVEQHGENPFFVDNDVARDLVKQLPSFRSGERPAHPILLALNNIQSYKREIGEINDQLNDLSLLAEEERIQVEVKRQERKELEVEKSRLNETIGDQKSRLEDHRTKLKKAKETLEALLKNIHYNNRLEAQIEITECIKRCLEAYVNYLKMTKRQAIQANYNNHINQLLDSNLLIDHVEIDDNFAINYRDKQGNLVPMASISAGMKQISATALLWALKDVSNRFLPVIVDTPLARIDSQHQTNILTRYYPDAAEQVIILPTDSELDNKKEHLLRPYVRQTFRLINPEGDATHIKETNVG